MAPETVAVVETKESLLEQLQAKMALGDFGAVKAIAGKIDGLNKAEQAKKDEETKEAREALTAKVKAAMDKAADRFYSEIGDLVGYDRLEIKYVRTPDLTTVAIMKATEKPKVAKKASGNGGGGGAAKAGPPTEELMAQFGSEEYKDGQTFAQAWEANTDKNWRYTIRKALLAKVS